MILRVANEQFPTKRPRISIPLFNDNTHRKFEDIELVMEKAAILREEEGASDVRYV